MSFRYMRLLLFFDLPRYTSKEMSAAARFVRDLTKEGFCMLQESVYTKLILNATAIDGTLRRLQTIKPKEGSIFLLTVTEKQFSNMEIVLGEIKTKNVSGTDRTVIV